MQLVCESTRIEDYLDEDEVVDYSHPLIQAEVRDLSAGTESEIERIHRTFEFVRDMITHSWDAQNPRVTCNASEVLEHRTGICYAKSHLLAALLRAQGIPVGICYQRLTLGETPESGYALHALNAAYISSLNRWVRIDARGNKPGVQAEFSLDQECLAFIVRPELDEIDYPTIFAHPQSVVVDVLRRYRNSLTMYQFALPERL
ncbi:transglutaminase-like domain-containing protein [Ktedonospora formicarum]|uniref:Cro/Cl family transcriptional regulator n=1 Tax=Ktedonospora formicarum TaxID=2778364 RepID=A0A8J3I617_9CHLR|nr:transglutaminase family protein [Ktedonospora formicarum]GHO46548.1 Cro/Cl family transcriptional regulator [Ktedonospora formicarum]